MTRLRMRTVISLFALLVVCIGGWVLMYPTSSDQKNIKYVLWKDGLYRVNLEVATTTMIGDPGRDKLVVGKTKTQLGDKFGPLVSVAEVSPYVRDCYQKSFWKDRDVLFIAQSPWMVVFEGDKATNLVLVKGC